VSGDPLAYLSRLLDLAGSLIDGVQPEQTGLPTPCRSWDVRALVAHLVNDTAQFTAAAAGGRPDWEAPTAAIGGDLAAAFRTGAAGLRAAWQEAGDLSQEVDLPIGRVPKSFVASQQIAEFAVHCWDLAAATGQRADFPAGACESALAWARTALLPQFRGDETSGMVFGPEVPVHGDTSAEDRLAAFFGRHPSRVLRLGRRDRMDAAPVDAGNVIRPGGSSYIWILAAS
jgi:uncharacterized protein (TIGR03086 family)